MISQENCQPSIDLVARLRGVPDTLRRLCGERTMEELQQPAQDGGVAVVELLCDLQDWEEITGERITRILREQRPLLESYDDSLWNIEHDYASRDAHAVIEAFAISRERNVEILADLGESAWQREAELENRGPVTLQWLMERTANHDDRHIAEIMEALA
ncbi:MAG: DinB family protein [Thermomicrobiales bacterium]|nr:DinB family protein [Thermomicrobiales bacterium]